MNIYIYIYKHFIHVTFCFNFLKCLVPVSTSTIVMTTSVVTTRETTRVPTTTAEPTTTEEVTSTVVYTTTPEATTTEETTTVRTTSEATTTGRFKMSVVLPFSLYFSALKFRKFADALAAYPLLNPRYFCIHRNISHKCSQQPQQPLKKQLLA